MMRVNTCLGSALIVLVLPMLAFGASIELVAPDQTCHLDISAGHPIGTFSIVAVGGAQATCCPGFTGAEFGIQGLIGNWLMIATPNPSAAVVVGGPIGDGVIIAFAADLMDPSVLLFTVSMTYLEEGTPPPMVLRVVAKNPPSNPNWPCPRVTGGGNCPCWAFACATGGQLYVNTTGDCLVGVEPVTWSEVKGLYE